MADERKPSAFTRTELEKHVTMNNGDARKAFVERVRTAFKGAGFSTAAKLHDAVCDVSPDDALSVPTWQLVFTPNTPSAYGDKAIDRLLRVFPRLLPECAALGLELIADAKAFELTYGVGPHFPRGFRIPISEAFERWFRADPTQAASAGAAKADALTGFYDIYFPILEGSEGCFSHRIACGKARICRDGLPTADGRRGTIFESYCDSRGRDPAHYSGEIRFTGKRSAILIGFSAVSLTKVRRDLGKLPSSEMLMHPYRLPEAASGWWHGATTFIESGTNEYAGTVPHVMRRCVELSEADPSGSKAHEEVWNRFLETPTEVLTPESSGYELVIEELRACPIVSLKGVESITTS